MACAVASLVVLEFGLASDCSNAWSRFVGPRLEFCGSRLENSVVGVVEVEGDPNSASTSWSCKAWSLNCATSPGGAFCKADATVGDDRTEDRTLDPELDKVWSRVLNPGFTDDTVPIAKMPSTFVSAARREILAFFPDFV